MSDRPNPATSAAGCPTVGAIAADAVLFARWYNVPTKDGADFLDWLHSVHLPWLAKTPGIAWVAHFRAAPAHDLPELTKLIESMRAKPADVPSVGTGTRYLLLAGAQSPSPFVGADEFDRPTTPQASRFLALRDGVRTSIFSEFIRVDGPASAARPVGTPPLGRIQFGTYQTHPGSERRVWNWYVTRNNRQFADHPGAVQMRNLVACSGWARLAVLYEFTSIPSNFEWGKVSVGELRRAQADPSAFQFTDSLLHPPGTALFDRIWSADKQALPE